MNHIRLGCERRLGIVPDKDIKSMGYIGIVEPGGFSAYDHWRNKLHHSHLCKIVGVE
tara:strand:- start:18 stop:188 length:171 start_codon:yes stop_codon:yes gene_type:complete